MGSYKTKAGYIYTEATAGFPGRVVGKKCLEHHLVYWQHYGKLPKKGEHIHHINHVKDDNRIENLEIVNASDHMKYHTLERSRKRSIEANKRLKERNITKGLDKHLDESRGKPKLFQAQVDSELLDLFLKKKKKEKPKLTNQQFIEMFIVCYLENCKK